MILTTTKLIMEGFLCRDESCVSDRPGQLYFYPADTRFPHLEPRKTHDQFGTGFWSGNLLNLLIPEFRLHTEDGLYVGSKGLPDDISFDEKRPRKARIEMVITYESKSELENSYDDEND